MHPFVPMMPNYFRVVRLSTFFGLSEDWHPVLYDSVQGMQADVFAFRGRRVSLPLLCAPDIAERLR